MKYRIVIIILLAILLSACNLTLAEDVTPPPGYIPPTPMPTLVLYPPQTPNIVNGKAIFFEKCAACHGESGLGDGPQGIQLGVTVPAFALPEVARPSSPAQWYTVVTRGRIERFMPPFVSLNDQQRWDVVAYITSMHTSPEEIAKGKKLFEENCANCPLDFYKDSTKMSGLSTVAIARIVRLGNDEIPAFGENLSDEEMWAVAEYLRSLTYDTTPPAAPTTVPATQTPAPAEAEGTPMGTEQAAVPTEAITPAAEGFGTVSGFIDNQTGKDLPSDLKVTLRGYEHDFQNPNAGTQEVLTLDDAVNADGTFFFENVEMPENRIFLAEVSYMGIDISTDFQLVAAGQTTIVLPPLVLHDTSEDTSLLTMDELNIFFTINDQGAFDIFALYNFRNTSTSTVTVAVSAQDEIPFLRFPLESQGLGYEAVQDSAPFTNTTDGFAIAPSDQPYGILAFSSIPVEKETSVSQPVELPVTVVRVFVPDGMQVESDQMTEDAQQTIQADVYNAYFANNLQANDVLNITITGTPKAVKSTDGATNKNSLLIGASGLGLALILAGAWMYMRDRNRSEEDCEDEDDDEFETSEDVMDAIIALDDLHRANKISDEAYQKRRDELKDILKDLM